MQKVATALVWPSPPEETRIAYVGSIEGPNDAGVKRSGFKRFANWLTGADKINDQLVKPFGLSLDENDNPVFTDTGANTVCYLDRVNKKWHRWRQVGKLRWISPVAAAKQNQVLYVADSGRAAW